MSYHRDDRKQSADSPEDRRAVGVPALRYSDVMRRGSRSGGYDASQPTPVGYRIRRRSRALFDGTMSQRQRPKACLEVDPETHESRRCRRIVGWGKWNIGFKSVITSSVINAERQIPLARMVLNPIPTRSLRFAITPVSGAVIRSIACTIAALWFGASISPLTIGLPGTACVNGDGELPTRSTPPVTSDTDVSTSMIWYLNDVLPTLAQSISMLDVGFLYLTVRKDNSRVVRFC